MPIPTRDRLRALTEDLGSQARLASILGVSRSRVSRWLKTEEPDAENRRKVEGLDFILTRLLTIYERDTALKWLQGFNTHLRGRRPIDVITTGRIVEVIEAIDAEQALTYG